MKAILRRLFPLFVVVAVLAGVITGWSQRWAIHDWWRLRNYKPPATIAKLATDTTMNKSARKLFYVYHPEIESKERFNEHCRTAEHTIVLGCYVPTTGIYISDIRDKRLDGVLQVTAAHEMLHAAYDRLEGNEKKRIDELLNGAFKNLRNKRIRETINDYRQNGADTTNELHSILATEVRNLPAELEKYYKQYFTDRIKVVSYSEKYEAAFTARKAQLASYDQQLAKLKQQIDVMRSSLAKQASLLSAERAELDSYVAAKNYKAYNAGVTAYNQQVNRYNTAAVNLKNLINTYNDLVAKRNTIALENNELIKAIDNRQSTIQLQ